ncbi:MAG: fibronectin type III domain-containing protein [Clostridiales bacterium]|nr:fibronectin type III domain-containing protein [Clostridiales bacterium]
MPDHILLSFCGDSKTQMAVSWRTDENTKNGYAVIREKSGNSEKKVTAVSRLKATDIDRSTYHYVNFDFLSPGTEYEYSVGDEKNRSAFFTFRTQKENTDKFKFMVITDHQSGDPLHLPDYSHIGSLIKDALNKHPGIEFILTGGDNCNDGENDLQWNGMFEGLKGIIEEIPFMMTTGNHDNRGHITYFPEPTGKFYLEHADFFDFQFEGAFPQNGPEGYKTENYSFDYGNSHFTVMGINAPEKVSEWAFNDIHSSEKEWKIATYHFPIYPVMPEGQNDDGYPWLRKPIEEGRPDILIEGHEHSFARTFPTVNDELFDRPSQGVVHYIAGNAGGNIYHSNAQKVWHSCFYPQEEKQGLYSIFEIDGKKLTATAYMRDGRVADKFEIDKESDTIYPPSLAPVYDFTKFCFKGRMLEMATRECYGEEKDGVWYAPLGAIMQGVGAKVEKGDNFLKIEAYGHRATFTAGKKEVLTDGGTITLKHEPYFSRKQLYVPAFETDTIFGMKCSYSKRNNFLNWNSPSEDKIMYPHPGQ